jgi:hypothetical protein
MCSGAATRARGHVHTLPRSDPIVYDSRKSEEKEREYPRPTPVSGGKVFDGRPYRPTDYHMVLCMVV